MNTFHFLSCSLLLASCLIRDSAPLSSLLYPAPLCALPSLPSPSLGPPARSFPRTACSQHPLPDRPIGIKGPLPLAEHMAQLQLCYNAVIIPITPEAVYCTSFLHIHTRASSHASVNPKAQLTQDADSILCSHSYASRILKSGGGCLLLHTTGHLSEWQRMHACKYTDAHRQWKKSTWPMLTDSQHCLN